MPSSDSSTPRDYEDTAGFRETTLYLFPPRDAAALRHVGRLLHTLTLEAGPYFGKSGESLTRRELQAALRDTLHLRDFLAAVAREVEESELGGDDARLSLFAGGLVAAVQRIAEALEEGLKG